MASNKWIMGTAGALVVGLVTYAAQAAPTTNSATDLRVAAGDASVIDKTASRRCWRRNGQRHCARNGGTQVYGYRNAEKYEEFIADKRPFGTSSWWDQMVRENRAGNPGGGGRR